MPTDTPTGSPRWPVRAIGCSHFVPPTHRMRRDGLDDRRSVLLPVALDRDDYAFAPPAAPSSHTDRFCNFDGFSPFA